MLYPFFYVYIGKACYQMNFITIIYKLVDTVQPVKFKIPSRVNKIHYPHQSLRSSLL